MATTYKALVNINNGKYDKKYIVPVTASTFRVAAAHAIQSAMQQYRSVHGRTKVVEVQVTLRRLLTITSKEDDNV